MSKGGHLLLISGCLLAGCAASHQVQVRAIPVPGASGKTGNALLAQARGELAIGNVGLALESFRTLLREQPESAETYEGIAECYAAMGRYDLTRTNLEFALAYAPNDPKLLTELAVTLDKSGEHERAVQAMAEASRLRAAAAPPTPAPVATISPIGVAQTGSVTVKLPEPSRHVAPDPVKVASSTPAPVKVAAVAPAPVVAVAAAPVPTKIVSVVPEPPMTPLAMAIAKPAKAEVTPVGVAQASMPTRPIAQEVAPVALPAEPAPVPAPKPVRAPPPADFLAQDTRPHELATTPAPADQGPRLERTSRGEVALITAPVKSDWAKLDAPVTLANVASAKPQRQAPDRPAAPRALAEATVRWISLRPSEPQNVELLNAARHQGLAADTRTALLNRGWRKIGIGDAREVRARSLVLYGKNRAHLAYRLAAQFRCKTQKIAGLKKVIVLLGRDALHRSTTARA